MFSIITRYQPGCWPIGWPKNCVPGDLLIGEHASLLCISPGDSFLVLSDKQVHEQEPILWPDHTKQGKFGRVVGNSLFLD